jgi:hypothetical protein
MTKGIIEANGGALTVGQVMRHWRSAVDDHRIKIATHRAMRPSIRPLRAWLGARCAGANLCAASLSFGGR